MRFNRRDFLKHAAALPTAVGLFLLAPSASAESLALNWPNAVIQVPTNKDEDKPPVITAVAVHPQGRVIATAGDDHKVYLWDIDAAKIIHELNAHADWVHTLAFSPGGEALVSAGADRRVIFWETATAKKQFELDFHEHAVTKIAWSHNGSWLAGTGFEDKLRIYNIQTRSLVSELKCPCSDMRTLDFSADDSLLAAGGRDGVVRLWRTADGQKLIDYHAHRHRIRGVEFSPDGRFIVSSGEDRQIHVRPIDAQNPAAETAGFNLPNSAAKVMSLKFYGPQFLATGCSDNVIRLWDVQSRIEIGKLRGHTGSVTALAAHANLLVSGSYDATVRIWTISENVAGDGVRPTSPLRTSRKPN